MGGPVEGVPQSGSSPAQLSIGKLGDNKYLGGLKLGSRWGGGFCLANIVNILPLLEELGASESGYSFPVKG